MRLLMPGPPPAKRFTKSMVKIAGSVGCAPNPCGFVRLYVTLKRSLMECTYCPPLFCGTTFVPRIAENPAVSSEKLDAISPKQKFQSNQTMKISSKSKFKENLLFFLVGIRETVITRNRTGRAVISFPSLVRRWQEENFTLGTHSVILTTSWIQRTTRFTCHKTIQ